MLINAGIAGFVSLLFFTDGSLLIFLGIFVLAIVMDFCSALAVLKIVRNRLYIEKWELKYAALTAIGTVVAAGVASVFVGFPPPVWLLCLLGIKVFLGIMLVVA